MLPAAVARPTPSEDTRLRKAFTEQRGCFKAWDSEHLTWRNLEFLWTGSVGQSVYRLGYTFYDFSWEVSDIYDREVSCYSLLVYEVFSVETCLQAEIWIWELEERK